MVTNKLQLCANGIVALFVCMALLAISHHVFGLAGVSVYDFKKEPVISAEVKKEIVQAVQIKKKVAVKPVVKKKTVVVPVKPVLNKCKSNVRTDLVNYAFEISGGDMKFIGTIAAESMFDVASVGDHGRSYGLCQIHRWYNAAGQKEYRALKTDKEKLAYCYKMYKTWNDKGIVENRLYGSRVWQNGVKKLNISCQK